MIFVDKLIIAVYFIISLLIAAYFYKRSSNSSEDYFLSGRSLSWWVAGTTMVATTFAADTPLAVTELVAINGISGNWLWWNMVAGNVLTVFFFAKLWRRSGVLTDVEFIELRYSGKPAAFLRGFKAVYLGLFLNVIIMGWVNVALATILKIIFNVPDERIFIIVVAIMALVGLYSAISGLWGIAYTDIFQFFTAMIGTIVLAYFVIDSNSIGSIAHLKTMLPASALSFFPDVHFSGKVIGVGVLSLSFSAFIAHIFVQWWASWYPGSEPGGGGYVAQRMMSAKDERHSLLATLWFTIAHYALRPWPWIIVGLATIVLYPHLPLDDKKSGYILAMKDYLPHGFLGLLVASFLAAYMSTISTHLNWGSSYLINDLYKRFLVKDKSKKHYVFASRIATILLVILASVMIKYIHSIHKAWEFILETGAGLGLVLILRWFWWRINAWSEIVAMIVPFFAAFFSHSILNLKFPVSLFFIVFVTTVAWIIATFISGPEENSVLVNFYNRIKPDGPGWKKFAESNPSQKSQILFNIINWFVGIITVYSALFGIGKLIFQEYFISFILLGVAIISFVFLMFRLKRLEV